MRTIPDPGFAGDDGSAPKRLTEALSVYQQDPDGGYLPALAALCGARLLVPVLAVLDEVPATSDSGGPGGPEEEKSSAMPASGSEGSEHVEMAAVLIQRPDGRKALLAFTSSQSLTGWNADARPVLVTAATAALAAAQEDADALLVDLAGPVRLVVEGEDLAALARGWKLVALDDDASAGWGWETDVH